MWVGNAMLVVLNLPLIGIWIKLLKVPYRLLYPAILLFCSIGVYSINNTHFDVSQTAAFGLLGVIFMKLECEPAPLLLGFVLGPMMEENLRRALLLSRGDPTRLRHAAAVAGDAADGRRVDRHHRPAQRAQDARRSVRGGSVATMDFDWQLPYASRRQPVLARNVVATSQPLAVQAGLAMLQRGGCAVDAALAAAITLTVVEPCSNGIGSDLFAILWDGRELIGLNASGRAPAAVTPARYAGLESIPARSWEAVTIPGAVAGWAALSQRFGSLPFADLFAPAIRYARDGYAVSPIVAGKWAAAVDALPHELGFAEHFMPGGRAPQAGECSVARRWRARSSGSRRRTATRSITASWPKRWSRTRSRISRCTRWRTSRRTRSTG